MGLKLSVTYKGFSADHFEINDIRIGPHNGKSWVEVALWKDSATFNADTLKANILERVKLEWFGNDYPFTGTNLNPLGANPVTVAEAKLMGDQQTTGLTVKSPSGVEWNFNNAINED